MTTWEYHIEGVNLEYEVEYGKIKSEDGEYILWDLLRNMGAEGWELAGFVPAMPEKHSTSGALKNPWVFYAVFKRPSGEI